MDKKILLLTPSPLKQMIVKEACDKVFKDAQCQIESYDIGGTEFKHIISKNECLEQMRSLTKKAKSEFATYDYYISMLGRFDVLDTHMEECAMVFVEDSVGLEGYSQAASFLVPGEVTNLMKTGFSFSKAVEKVFNLENVKEGTGFVGHLTGGIVTKAEQYFHPLVIALSTCLMNEQKLKSV